MIKKNFDSIYKEICALHKVYASKNINNNDEK